MKTEGYSATNGAEQMLFHPLEKRGGGQGQHGLACKTAESPSDEKPSSSLSEANTSAGGLGSDGSPQARSHAPVNKSRYRGVSYDRKKAKWRVQIKVAALGKSGVSVGYFDTEEAAARAYDRAAIGLLGRDAPNLQTNFDVSDYSEDSIPCLSGKTREEVKTTLKSERIKQAPRRRFMSRQRTSKYMGVGSSNRKNQWQARILVHGKVTHLGYYETEEEAAKVYDRVSLALHGMQAQTNFPVDDYPEQDIEPFRDLDRESLQRALGVKPMDKSSKYRGVSKKKGKWEAKVMVNRRWAYRELFDSEEAAARAYDKALWRLKPAEAQSYVNFKDEAPNGVKVGVRQSIVEDMSMDDGRFGECNEVDSDDDFEYEYRPTKGTSRSEKMRAKKNMSGTHVDHNHHSAARAKAAPNERHRQHGRPQFSITPGEGLKFTSGSIESDVTPVGMIPNQQQGSFDEPLLIRVGSESHILAPDHHMNAGSSTDLVTKRHSGMKRVTSEPQFSHVPFNGEPLGQMAVPGTYEEIHDFMHEKDIFGGVDLGELTGSLGQPEDHDLQHIHDFVTTSGVDMHGGSSELMFEDDEEMALTNLEQNARPRKLNKSISMQNLSCVDISDASNVTTANKPPLPGTMVGRMATLQTTDRNLPPKPVLRRINTYTSALPSLEEEYNLARSHNSSDEDLVKKLWGAAPAIIGMPNTHSDDVRAFDHT
ncbi:APETALA2-like protein 4 [Picochlorum sp. SENEW3]|nr:APETALA2-like protein 4 [Picochlorum sp. SENEW3]